MPENNDNIEIFFLCVLTTRSIPLANTIKPVCPNSDQPESPLSETNCYEQISPNAFHFFNLETLLSNTDSEFRNRYVISIEQKR